MKLQYVGNGAALPGIPARDLSAEDIKRFAKPALKQWEISQSPEKWLIGTGLYRKPAEDIFLEEDGGNES